MQLLFASVFILIYSIWAGTRRNTTLNENVNITLEISRVCFVYVAITGATVPATEYYRRNVSRRYNLTCYMTHA